MLAGRQFFLLPRIIAASTCCTLNTGLAPQAISITIFALFQRVALASLPSFIYCLTPVCTACSPFERASLRLRLNLLIQWGWLFEPRAPDMAGSPRDRSRSRTAPRREPESVRPSLSHQISMAVADAPTPSSTAVTFYPFPLLIRGLRWATLSAWRIWRPNTSTILMCWLWRMIRPSFAEAALAAHPTTLVPATPGEPSASGSSQLAR